MSFKKGFIYPQRVENLQIGELLKNPEDSKLGFRRIFQEKDIIYSAGQDNRVFLCTLLLFKNICKPKHYYMA